MTTPNLTPEHRSRLTALADLLELLPDRPLIGSDWLDLMRPLGFDPWEDAHWDTWEWTFGAGWHAPQRTPRGAAARIRYLLEHGLPEDWREQMSGERPLCYAERVEGR